MNIDPNKIFQLFDSQEDDQKQLLDFRNHPIYFVLMFKKLILNHLQIRNKSIELIKEAHPDLDEKDIEKAGNHICFSKAFDYLKLLNLEDINHTKHLEQQFDNDLIKTLNCALEYFLSCEEYEKCAFIRDVLNKVVIVDLTN